MTNEDFVPLVVKMDIRLHFEDPNGKNWLGFVLFPFPVPFIWSDLYCG